MAGVRKLPEARDQAGIHGAVPRARDRWRHRRAVIRRGGPSHRRCVDAEHVERSVALRTGARQSVVLARARLLRHESSRARARPGRDHLESRHRAHDGAVRRDAGDGASTRAGARLGRAQDQSPSSRGGRAVVRARRAAHARGSGSSARSRLQESRRRRPIVRRARRARGRPRVEGYLRGRRDGARHGDDRREFSDASADGRTTAAGQGRAPRRRVSWRRRALRQRATRPHRGAGSRRARSPVAHVRRGRRSQRPRRRHRRKFRAALWPVPRWSFSPRRRCRKAVSNARATAEPGQRPRNSCQRCRPRCE